VSQDNIDLEDLQRFQDDFAKDIGLASVTVKLKGVTNALNDGLGLISSTMEQLATSAGDISKRQTDLNNEIVSVNAVTDKIDAVINFIREIANETRLLGVNAATESPNAIEVTKAIEAANELAAAQAIEAALAITAARAIEAALAIAKAKATSMTNALEAANQLAAVTAIEAATALAAATAIETTNTNPVVKAVETALGLLLLGLGLGAGLGVIAPEVRKRVAVSPVTETNNTEIPCPIEPQEAVYEPVTASVEQRDPLVQGYRLTRQRGSGCLLFRR